jgi:predicted pyridoxine 5'-phosphate oxidase superfamily flavin-nucleotide-binding protein
MGKVHAAIEGHVREFIEAQRMFFVGSAPLDRGGHVNVSPKGGDSFRILGPATVAYLDYTGSGVETIAHLRENCRIVLMFCAFEGPPNIIRLHGRGEVIEPHEAEFATLLGLFDPDPGVRAIIRIHVDRVSSSCGYSVPRCRYEGERTQLAEWASRKGEDGLKQYRAEKNSKSIDGLAALLDEN